jgi:hypothetical protein
MASGPPSSTHREAHRDMRESGAAANDGGGGERALSASDAARSEASQPPAKHTGGARPPTVLDRWMAPKNKASVPPTSWQCADAATTAVGSGRTPWFDDEVAAEPSDELRPRTMAARCTLFDDNQDVVLIDPDRQRAPLLGLCPQIKVEVDDDDKGGGARPGPGRATSSAAATASPGQTLRSVSSGSTSIRPTTARQRASIKQEDPTAAGDRAGEGLVVDHVRRSCGGTTTTTKEGADAFERRPRPEHGGSSMASTDSFVVRQTGHPRWSTPSTEEHEDAPATADGEAPAVARGVRGGTVNEKRRGLQPRPSGDAGQPTADTATPLGLSVDRHGATWSEMPRLASASRWRPVAICCDLEAIKESLLKLANDIDDCPSKRKKKKKKSTACLRQHECGECVERSTAGTPEVLNNLRTTAAGDRAASSTPSADHEHEHPPLPCSATAGDDQQAPVPDDRETSTGRPPAAVDPTASTSQPEESSAAAAATGTPQASTSSQSGADGSLGLDDITTRRERAAFSARVREAAALVDKAMQDTHDCVANYVCTAMRSARSAEISCRGVLLNPFAYQTEVDQSAAAAPPPSGAEATRSRAKRRAESGSQRSRRPRAAHSPKRKRRNTGAAQDDDEETTDGEEDPVGARPLLTMDQALSGPV